MSDYHIIITDAGAALETAAHAAGEPLVLTEFAVCDGDGAFTPDPAMTSLNGEAYRGEISSLSVSPDEPSVLVAQCIIPASSGGYTIRGIGLYAGDTLYAVGNYPDQPKPAPDSGYAASLEILAQLAVSDTADVTLNVTDGAWLTKQEGDKLYVPLARQVNGHALTEDITLTADDVGAMAPGAFGLGGNRITVNAALHTYFPGKPSGFYGGGGDIGDRLTTGWFDAVWIQHGTDGKYGALIEFGSGGQVATHVLDNGTWKVQKLYNDYSACPVKASYPGPFAFAEQYNSSAAFYEDVKTSGTSEFHPLVKQRLQASTNAYSYSFGTLISGGVQTWCLYIRGSAGHEFRHSWDTSGNYSLPGQIKPGNWANFDARYYTQTAANARYVQNVRVGAAGTFKINHNAWSEAPVGAFITGWYYEGDNPGGDSVHYRPIQINVNGSWRTIAA